MSLSVAFKAAAEDLADASPDLQLLCLCTLLWSLLGKYVTPTFSGLALDTI